MSAAAASAVGVLEIGGTHVAAGLVDVTEARPRLLVVDRTSLDAQADADVLLELFQERMTLIAQSRPLTWGIAIPGPFDYANGIARFADVGKFDALSGIDVRSWFAQRMSQPDAEFVFLNDASAFVLGEWLAGAAQHRRRVVGLTLGTGIGSAFVRDGELVDDGDDVPPHGHVYLLTHDGRPLEDAVSRRALLQRYADLVGGRDDGIDVRELAELARTGDIQARLVLDESFHALGTVLAPWIASFRADTVVVGGSIARAWDLIAGPLTHGLGEYVAAQPCDVVPATAQDAALIGAAWYAAQRSR